MRHSLALALTLAACRPTYDIVIRNGTIYDGTGSPGVKGDVAIKGDSIVATGAVGDGRGKIEIDATGMAVAPGFVNMLSHAEDALVYDGRSQSGIRQGVTLEVLGEGSMGPITDTMKKVALDQQTDIKYPITWTTLGEYLDTLVAHGISTNVASFVGAGTVRTNVVGWSSRSPTAAELERMKALVRQGMEDGAVGLTTALIYVPDFYAKTDELIAMAKVAAQYGGIYTAHMRSEGNRLLEALDEHLRIAREAGIPAEIYHLKAAGKPNWPKMDQVIARVNQARAAGLAITADMYTYPAGATGLDAAMPPWVQEGGITQWIARLKQPEVRARVKREMATPTDKWENLFLASGSPENIRVVEFKQDSLKYLTGKTLAEVARLRKTSPQEAAMDLVIADGTRVGTVYFLMSEDNIRKEIRQPWVSFGSDAGSLSDEGVFLKSNPHPRAYGNFARLLGKYVREEQVIPLEEAVRRLSLLPATNLKLARRGALKPGYFADVVVFDPATIADHATFEKPHQYATGMKQVFVNGVQVLKDGEHTGAKPGRVVRGAGWKRTSPPTASRNGRRDTTCIASRFGLPCREG
jgi:N-acyl-D-amino-acid deacylase